MKKLLIVLLTTAAGLSYAEPSKPAAKSIPPGSVKIVCNGSASDRNTVTLNGIISPDGGTIKTELVSTMFTGPEFEKFVFERAKRDNETKLKWSEYYSEKMGGMMTVSIPKQRGKIFTGYLKYEPFESDGSTDLIQLKCTVK
ncbi:MAG: hypothetical protein WCS77_03280 [Elusimicrobiaceae bacterium]|jgi:hypothetical protein